MITIHKPAWRAEILPVGATPVGIPASSLSNFTGGSRVTIKEALIVVEGGPARVSFTSDQIGHLLPTGTIIHLAGAGNLKAFSALQGGKTPSSLSITYFE